MKSIFKLFLVFIFLALHSCSYLPEEIDLVTGVEMTETTDYIKLSPQNTPQKSTGVFFYPGGLVDYHAYIPLWQKLAAEGYLVLILKVTGNAAILNSSKTQPLLDNFEGIDRWIVSGHSLGGIKACLDAGQNPEDYAALILMASYPFNVDLSDWSGTALSLYGENDLVIDMQEVNDAKIYLPPALEVDSLSQFPMSPTSNQSIYHRIEGGNHAYFGNYGEQDGDGVATITRSEQQEIVMDYILAFLNANSWN
jgi:hypothetical protein